MRQRADLVFSLLEYERRLTALRERMAVRGLDAVITTIPENICYLSGFESPGHYYFNALIVPLEGEPVAVPRQLEVSGYEELTWLENIRFYTDTEDPIHKLYTTLVEFGLHYKRLGYEKNSWFFTAAQQDRLFAYCSPATFVDCSGLVEAGRLIKSEVEIDLMRQAARTTEAGMRAGVEAVAAGVTENDIAAEIHYAMIKAGSEWPSIQPFVASGYRGAIGHATWAGRTLENGDCVMLELAGCLKRYHAPLMRSGFVGEPDPVVKTAEHVVHEAFEATVAAIKPGVSAGEVDAVARGIIAASQFGGTQASRTAYSVGIGLPPDWGEGQILSIQPKEPRLLEANMTFHLLPWVQLPGIGGISFSETIRVTETGCELLTNFDRSVFVK
ncbi:MAG: aminopeptidase P family protein [Anaerolineae bacterium]|nr:aminopeptidase P family protein [Anaerolineae bacterium]